MLLGITMGSNRSRITRMLAIGGTLFRVETEIKVEAGKLEIGWSSSRRERKTIEIDGFVVPYPWLTK